MPHANASNPDKTLSEDFLARLIQYKEFIVILVFFLGGVMWIYGYFATKKQLDEFKCFTNINMAILRNSMLGKNIQMELIAKKEELAEVEALKNPVNRDKKRKVRLGHDIELLREALKLKTTQLERALNKLREDPC